jgi:hypothetical protein
MIQIAKPLRSEDKHKEIQAIQNHNYDKGLAGMLGQN